MTPALKKTSSIIAVVLAAVLLPVIGTQIKFSGKIPAGFFNFPPIAAEPKQGFNLLVFIAIGLVWV